MKAKDTKGLLAGSEGTIAAFAHPFYSEKGSTHRSLETSTWTHTVDPSCKPTTLSAQGSRQWVVSDVIVKTVQWANNRLESSQCTALKALLDNMHVRVTTKGSR